jgi:hypothetical protein
MKLVNKALLAAALGLALAGPTFAEEDAFNLELAGNHEFGYRMPAYSRSSFDYAEDMRAPSFSNEFDLAVRDKDVKIVSDWSAALRPLATDSAGEYGSWDRLVKARALENYVSWSPSGFKLSAGYQVFSWGVADKRNPTDNLNPRDYSAGVNADKIPVLAADAIWYPTDSISVEGVFAPTAQKSIYPVDFAEEIPAAAFYGLSLSLPSTKVPVANAKSISVESTLEPKDAIAGGKLSYRSSAIDCSASYLYDVDPLYTPIITTSREPIYVTGTSTATGAYFTRVASISLERERIHRFGLDAKATIGAFGLWVEAAYSLTGNDGSEDYSCRKSDLNYVLGCDFNVGPNGVGYVNLQYIGSWIPGFDDSFYSDYEGGKPSAAKVGDQAYMEEYYQRAMVNGLGLQTEGLLQGVTANLKWEFAGGAITPQATAVYIAPFQYDDAIQKRYGSLALNPEIDLKPVDSFHIKLGADLAYSWVKPAGESVRLDTSTDKIGVYTPSNNVYLKVLYKWNYDL